MKTAIKYFVKELIFERDTNRICKTKVSFIVATVISILKIKGYIDEQLMQILLVFTASVFGAGVRDIFKQMSGK